MRLLMAIVVVCGAVACDSPNPELTLPPLASVKVALSAVPGLCAGQSVQLQASVTGTSDGRVIWRSSNEVVAAIDSAGLLKTITAGSAVVTAAALADPKARDSVAITVSPTVSYYDYPSIAVTKVVLHNTNTPIDPTRVSGVIDVYAEADIPPCLNGLSWRIKLNNQQICNEGVTQRHFTALCIIDTAERTVDGQRRFANGPATLKLDMPGTTGVIVASNTFQPFTILNSP